MVELAQQSKDRVLTLDMIAQRQRVKPKYLEQIFIKLHHAKLIESKKGPGGGYIIGRDPGTISLGEIMKAVGETTAPVMCAEDKADKYCSGLTGCSMQPCWIEFKKLIDNFVDTLTIDDIMHGKHSGI
jgi:Rrf2 family iron-sulfur cluster assembly transcriptional regulator